MGVPGPWGGRIQGPHLFPPRQRVLKGEGAVRDGGLWGLSNPLQAGAGGATVSKRPREPVFLGLPCSLPGPPFKAQFCEAAPLRARGSSVSVTYTPHLPRAGRERGSWKGSQCGWEGTEQGTQRALPSPAGASALHVLLTASAGTRRGELTRELTHGPIYTWPANPVLEPGQVESQPRLHVSFHALPWPQRSSWPP